MAAAFEERPVYQLQRTSGSGRQWKGHMKRSIYELPVFLRYAILRFESPRTGQGNRHRYFVLWLQNDAVFIE